MGEIWKNLKGNHNLTGVFIANFFTAFHYFLLGYINSSFLGGFFSANTLGFIYIIASLASTILLIKSPDVLNRFGNINFLLFFIGGEIISLVALALLKLPPLIVPFFIFSQISIFMMIFSLDIFLETVIKDESHTGFIRTSFITTANIALIISPIIVGFLVGDDKYHRVFLLAAALLVPAFIFSIKSLSKIEKPNFNHPKIIETWLELRRSADIMRITTVNFILQFFYAWMVVYTPIYLHQEVGFSWKIIGIIFTIMLLPFVIFEIPAGEMADKKYGEKEIIFMGLLIIAISVFFMPFIHSPSFLIWSAVLFLSRVGASIVEAGTESYFFKHVGGSDVNVISAFRIVRPLSYVAAPLVAFVTLRAFDLRNSYFVLAIIVSVGLYFILKIKDTK